MEALPVYQSFPRKEEAVKTTAILENKGIFVIVEENFSALDKSIIGEEFSNTFLLRISGESFADADRILSEATDINLDEVDKGYLLLSFTNDELISVMKHKSDWGIYNYKLAERLLIERNISIPQAEIVEAQKAQLVEKAKPIQVNVFWILLSYALTATAFYSYFAELKVVVALTPILYILVFGYTLYFSKKTLPDGNRYPLISGTIECMA